MWQDIDEEYCHTVSSGAVSSQTHTLSCQRLFCGEVGEERERERDEWNVDVIVNDD